MESGEDGLRTIECLRGRLLAERQASKVAKEEAQLLGNKIMELEKKLEEETKLTRKAEKKLKLLMKKLKIPNTLEGSEHSSSSENTGISCTSSITSISSPKNTEESKQSKSLSIEAVNSSHPLEETSSIQDNTCDSCPIHNFKDSYLGKSCCGSNLTSQHSDACYLRSKAFGVKMDNIEALSDNDHEDNGNTKLALVPVLPTASTVKCLELQTIDKSVGEVLAALRLIRQKIQSSIEKRNINFRDGPA